MKAIIATTYTAGIAGITAAAYVENGIGAAFAVFGCAMLCTAIVAALREYT